MLGGCCALIPGVAAALRDTAAGPIGLAYIDGHMDTYTNATSPTGEAADMPVAMVVGAVDPGITGLGPASPLIAPSRVALLAHRDREEATGYGAPMPEDLGIAISHDCDGGAGRPRLDRRAHRRTSSPRAAGASGSRSTSTCCRARPSPRRR